MNRNYYWKLGIVILTVLWSLYEIYPPTGRDITAEFQRRSVKRDAAYTNIVQQLKERQRQNPNRGFANLIEAIGTNDITHYFPFFSLQGQTDPNRYVINRLQRDGAGRIKLGLDLQGGSLFRVQMSTNALTEDSDRSRALSQGVEVLRKRVDKLGVAEPLIQPAGSDQIMIQLPGLSEADKENAKKQIQRAAFLEFRLVHERSQELTDAGIIEPGYEVLKEEKRQPDGTKRLIPYLVQKKPVRGLTGRYVKRAFVTRQQMSSQPVINFDLNSEGGRIFGEVTEANVGRQLAIVLDGVLSSAPVIKTAILGGSGIIEGDFDLKEAWDLAAVLENPLEAPVIIIEERSVDPSLGSDAIRSGIWSAIVGTLAVAAFMAIYYFFAGLVANFALALNLVILLGVMCYINTTLTLPGIAGIVLTAGMAVDANVLIFERIREESAKGKSLRGALAAGYARAFSTIFDSNLTTLISSVILIKMGTGSVKGFGTALTIGVTASMFTSLVVTRLIFDFLLYKNWIKSLPMLHMIRATKLNFMGFAKLAFLASWTLIVVGCGYGLFLRGEKALGIDFLGGDSVAVRYVQKVETGQLRSALEQAGVRETMIQYEGGTSGSAGLLRIASKTGTSDTVKAALGQAFPQAFPKEVLDRASVDKVGPVIGKEIQQTALLALLLSLFGILVYVAFRYEFSFAVGAVLAIVHDILMTIGVYSLTGLWGEGRQFNATTVAAFLTIVGFSVNDTIVIFDRIRENLKMGARGTFTEIINQSLNQTLSRTIITSGTVFLATMGLYLFGGGAINDFAFAFLVGILTGTYSSIYIATALVLWWHKGERPAIGAQVVMAPAAGVAPAKA